MSDTDIILDLLRRVEWRLRATRVLHHFMLAASIALAFIITLKVWDLFSPLGSRFAIFGAAAAVFLAGYSLWRLRERMSLEHAAASIDLKAGLNDEIKTAFWFIGTPRASVWVDTLIHRAARKAVKIDVRRVYPGTMPRSSYAAAAMAAIFIALQFVALPPPSQAVQPSADNAKPSVRDTVDVKAINEGLDEIAEQLAKSEKLKAVAEALLERRLDDAAGELRRVGEELATESPDSLEAIQESLNAAGQQNRREALKPLSEDLTEAARALMNKNVAGTQEGLDDIAQDLEGLDEEIYAQESTLDQLAKGNERRGEQDGHVPGAPIPDTRDFPQASSSPDGLGASGGKSEPGARQGPPTTLDAQLQEEGLKSMPTAGIKRIDVEEASRQERSKLDYRNVASELTAAQKDVLNHEEMPWQYRPLIKTYFESIVQPAKNK